MGIFGWMRRKGGRQTARQAGDDNAVSPLMPLAPDPAQVGPQPADTSAAPVQPDAPQADAPQPDAPGADAPDVDMPDFDW